MNTNRHEFKNCDACELPRSCQGVRSCAKKICHRPRDPQSMQGQVEAMVEQHGPCTVDQIAPHLPAFSRAQILAAMGNLRTAGRLVITDACKALGKGYGSAPAEYDLADRAAAKAITEGPWAGISSVWDLGRSA